MMNFSSLSAEEHLRLNGTLPVDMIEDLFDQRVDGEGVVANIDEAMAQYPEEDILSGVIDDLQKLSVRLRGSNRRYAQDIVERLDNISQYMLHASEYGREELRSAVRSLKE